MEKVEFNTQPEFASASDFLRSCEESIQLLNGIARKCLTRCDQTKYHRSLVYKGIFITDIKDYAIDLKNRGLQIPDHVMCELDALRDEAYDCIEAAIGKKDYEPLAEMLSYKDKMHHHHRNHLELLIHNLEQQEQ